MTYRDDFRAGHREYYWSLPRVVLAVAVTLILLGGVSFMFGVFSAPARVVSRTLETGNIIAKYEFFHDANEQINARTAQIKSHRGLLSGATDAAERSRLGIELASIQQSCRDLAAKYNANATKTNVSIFMGREAPSRINPNTCE